ncbi:helix-turn-helix domain-containing protein [Actinoplanes sp. TRM 88003]|uniref:Helix-turn-helix domain-containing protein n=1 Tax=Paractinoplanes aksuensis TaxID=2939490 RepID=A0ABT1DPC5_9ACTN|nr:helix-turn-helix transcriptional regulator [Actinoplanes aksuensis]MCO8272687.1 helix-turn-helix domain-containing protein [Actinoplanes aksuensis]
MSSDHGGSSVPRRQLGRRLRELRESASLTVAQVVTALEWSKPRLWRYETGQVPIHPNDVETMCRLYGAGPELTDALRELARQSKAKGWWHAYADIPEWFQLFLGMEQAASRLRQYEAEVIPGLVQSPAYARAITTLGPRELPPAAVEQRTAMRMQRQQILTRREPRAPELEIILSESALVRGFGAEIMADQLTALLAFTERPNVSIRVIPFSAGPHVAYQGPFVILDFPRETQVRDPEPTTIYQESPTGSLYLDKPSEVETYSAVWSGLDTVALDQATSRKLITHRLEGWSP